MSEDSGCLSAIYKLGLANVAWISSAAILFYAAWVLHLMASWFLPDWGDHFGAMLWLVLAFNLFTILGTSVEDRGELGMKTIGDFFWNQVEKALSITVLLLTARLIWWLLLA